MYLSLYTHTYIEVYFSIRDVPATYGRLGRGTNYIYLSIYLSICLYVHTYI